MNRFAGINDLIVNLVFWNRDWQTNTDGCSSFGAQRVALPLNACNLLQNCQLMNLKLLNRSCPTERTQHRSLPERF